MVIFFCLIYSDYNDDNVHSEESTVAPLTAAAVSGSFFTADAPNMTEASWSLFTEDGLAGLFTQRFNGIESSDSEQLKPVLAVAVDFFCALATAAAAKPLGKEEAFKEPPLLTPDKDGDEVVVECEGATGTGICLLLLAATDAAAAPAGDQQPRAASSLAVWAGKGEADGEDGVVMAHINKDCDFWLWCCCKTWWDVGGRYRPLSRMRLANSSLRSSSRLARATATGRLKVVANNDWWWVGGAPRDSVVIPLLPAICWLLDTMLLLAAAAASRALMLLLALAGGGLERR